MCKSFVLGFDLTKTFAGCGERPAAVKSMHSKTTHRHSFPNDGAKVLLFCITGWILCAYYAHFLCIFFNYLSFFLVVPRLISPQK